MNDYLKKLAELAEIDEPVVQTFYRGARELMKFCQNLLKEDRVINKLQYKP